MYKIALTGCGRISKKHIEAINQPKEQLLEEQIYYEK